MNPQSKELKETRNLHAIIVEILVTHQTNVGAMEKKNSMESVTIAANMVIRQASAKINQSLKENVSIVINKDTNL